MDVSSKCYVFILPDFHSRRWYSSAKAVVSSSRLHLVVVWGCSWCWSGTHRKPRWRPCWVPPLNNVVWPRVAKRQPNKWIDQPGKKTESACGGRSGEDLCLKILPSQQVWYNPLVLPVFQPLEDPTHLGLSFLTCTIGITLLLSFHHRRLR